MKLHTFYFLSGVLLSVLSAVSCTSEPKSADPKSTFAAMIGENLRQAQQLRQEHANIQQRFAELDQSMAVVPAEVKANVVRYNELENLLEGVAEKGDYRVQELDGVVTQLQTLRDDLAAGKAELVVVNNILVNLKPILTEHQGALVELAEQYKIAGEACAQVTASTAKGGRGLVLFAADSAAAGVKK